ncbi:MAG: response regulator transcription factor [Planctomycetales bacterium]|nr:response regulator transcription factor [Planctomycetales bacterium]
MKLMHETPTVFLVDPDPRFALVVDRIAAQMKINFKQFSTAEDFLAAYTSGTPGCIILEFRLLGISGIELQSRLATDPVGLPLIFATAAAELPFVVHVMQHGAISVLEKPVSELALWDAVQQAIARNQRVRRIDAKHSGVRKRLARLTQKERQVLELIVQGNANKTIARTLRLSIRTVETRRHHIFRKTGTQSVAELVRLVIQSESRDESS